MTQVHQAEEKIADAGRSNLFWFGGIAAITVLTIMVVSVVGYIIWPYTAGTTPTLEIFNLIQTNLWAAIIALDLGHSISNLVSILIYLALYIALKRVNKTFALTALVLGLVATATLIASRNLSVPPNGLKGLPT